GENVKISGFGKFEVRDKRERIGRNPRTGSPMPISARRVLTFKHSQVLRNALNASAPGED
ncbi:MAG: HU family DNA-binding protein, partial [Myxococcota bacterium]